MFRNWMKRVKLICSGAATKRPQWTLEVERLEDRVVLSDFIWVGKGKPTDLGNPFADYLLASDPKNWKVTFDSNNHHVTPSGPDDNASFNAQSGDPQLGLRSAVFDKIIVLGTLSVVDCPFPVMIEASVEVKSRVSVEDS
jgi:hypothetical protein